MSRQNSSQLLDPASSLPGMFLQAEKAYPFHNGWNIACFVILLLFILAVLSLTAFAFLYELVDCGCCAKEKAVLQLQEEDPALLQAGVESVSKHELEV